MSDNYKCQQSEAICIILIVMISKLIINIPYYITNLVGTGSIINLIYIGIIGFLFVLLINKLFYKFPNSDIFDISEYLGGKFLKNIVSIIFVISLFFVSYITLSDFANLLQTIYFKNSPMIFILLFFIIGIFTANIVGFKSIVRTINLIVPITIASIIIALLSVYDEISIDKFSPFFGFNFQTTFIDGILNIFSLYIISYYFFLAPLLKDSFLFKKITITSYIISWILLFFTIISISAIFPMEESSEPLNSLYLLARQVKLGEFFKRVDAIFILLWLTSIFSYLSISIFMINRIIKKITNIQNQEMLSFSTISIFFGLCLLPFNIEISHFIENTIYRYLIIIITFILCPIILILANLKFRLKRKDLKS